MATRTALQRLTDLDGRQSNGGATAATTRQARPTSAPVATKPITGTASPRSAAPAPNPNIVPTSGAPLGGPGAGMTGTQVAAAPNPNILGATPGTGGQGGYTNNTDPLTGWLAGRGYTPADVMGNNQMPSKYLYDTLDAQGYMGAGANGLFYMMEPLAEIAMPLYEILNGGGSAANRFTPESIGNYMGGFFQDMMTPDGRMPQQQQLVNNLMGATGTDTPLGAVLNAGTPEEQVDNLRKYLSVVGSLSGSPLYRQALSNISSLAGHEWMQGMQGGTPSGTTFNQSLVADYGPMFGW